MFALSIRAWAFASIILLLGGSSMAANRQLHGHVPGAVARLTSNGRLAATRQLQLAIGLPPRDEAGLATLLQQQYDPASPQFHQWLTPEQFTAKFGPSEQDYQALIAFAETNGLKITAKHPNRLVLDVMASAADVEKVFHITLKTFRHPREARDFFAPDIEPSLDAPVTILHVSGLDNFALPHPHSKKRSDIAGAKAAPRSGSGSGPSGTYRGLDFRAAYLPGVTLNGAGQSIGLLQFDGYYANDIATYVAQAGLPGVTLTNVAVDGGVSTPGDGVGEVSLDIEMVISMAPNLSRVIVYEAPNPSPWVDLLSKMANDNLAKQLSCSWGSGSADPSSEVIFQQMAAQGQSFFNATGDGDAFNGPIEFPSESTNITQVGGTTLTTSGPGGSYVSETVWNWGGAVGGSGGISLTYALPVWQRGISMTLNQGSTAMRNIPDVALTADNIYVVYTNGHTGNFGGTSCATPLWAGFMALVNQQAAANGQPSMGLINPVIYALGKSPNYSNIFHDVTLGNNASTNSVNRYYAVPGYDLCTGWGTPIGAGLINALTRQNPIVTGGSALISEGCSPTNGVIDPGETVTVNLALSNIGTAATTNVVATLLSSGGITPLSSAQNYGALSAGGTPTNKPFTFLATGLCGDSVVATWQLQDGAMDLGVVSNVYRLGKPVTVLSQNFDGVTAPALPSGWTLTKVGSSTGWTTVSGSSDSGANHAFARGASRVFDNRLTSPSFALTTTQAQLSFRHSYVTEFGYDGGTLEISINGGVFTNLAAAGGSFATNGFTANIPYGGTSPIIGMPAWSGDSGGYITTIANLPAAAAGKNVQLRWRFASDQSVSSTGWSVDTIVVTDATACCNPHDLALAVTAPAISTYAIATNTLSIAGTASSSAGVTQITWSNNHGGSGSAIGTVSWSIGGVTLQSGTNIITITAFDNAGNTNVVLLTVNFDQTAPAILINAPTTASTYSTTSGSVNLSGTASDAGGLSSVTWSNDRGGSGSATGLSTWNINGITLQSGLNNLTVTAQDAAGNTNTATLQVLFDTTSPVVTIASPTNAVFNTYNNTLHLAGTATDDNGIAQVTWTNSLGGGGSTIGVNNWIVNGIVLQLGANAITVTARDTAGNTGSASLTATFSPPSLALAAMNNLVTIAWPAAATNYVLQRLAPINPASTNWLPVTNIPIVIGNQNIVTNTISSTSALYRLKK